MINKYNFILPNQNLNTKPNNYKNNKNKTISILVKEDILIQNEINIYEIIKNIKNNQKYFFIFDSHQSVNLSEIDMQGEEENNISNIINNVDKKETNLILLNYKDKTLYSLFEYIHTQFLNNLQKIKIILDSFSYLLDSIQLLLDYNIVHNNINSNTVYFTNNHFTCPILLKFDNSIIIYKNSKNIIETNIFPYCIDFNINDIYFPIELQLLSYLKFNKLTSLSHNHIEIIIEFIFKKYNDNKYIKLIKNINIIETFKEEYYNYLNTFVNKSIETIMNEVSVFYYSWDIYKLSIYFLEIILQLDIDSSSMSNFNYNLILEKITNLLIKNIHPNPLKRPNLQQIKINLQELLP